ncbi:uncharacterized protein LOC117208461 isoform X2 [Bombus bifarius]|uniref:Uncharacterized protein LOC117208461 isoform X2 n=1 Tax=Bombus bifarius TaxID=103933 RepID=A0A6P8LWX8_9HYME|nr:uncharacterized protein LOC117162306 isoform X2 [Bombus vancouverensis nearcticus]XP_033305551.1 uncharacterized protein LOC117208461 isoform X2 [Bombus bifarius]
MFHQVQSSIKELFTLSDCIGEISRSQRFFCMVFKSILCILQFFIATLAFTGRFFIYLFMEAKSNLLQFRNRLGSRK